jgi:hypothetical protein
MSCVGGLGVKVRERKGVGVVIVFVIGGIVRRGTAWGLVAQWLVDNFELGPFRALGQGELKKTRANCSGQAATTFELTRERAVNHLLETGR